MKTIRPIVAVCLIVALTLASGLLHGRLSNRWGPSDPTRLAAEKLAKFPSTSLGLWELVEDAELRENEISMLQCAEYFNRTYRHQESGETVRMVLLLGPHGPTAVHTPEFCYSTRDYEVLSGPLRVTLAEDDDSEGAELWQMTLKTRKLDGHLLRTYYGWSNGTQWTAPAEPRLSYLGEPFLYKLQIASAMPPIISEDDGNQQAGDACLSFLNVFLPELEAYLATAP